MAFVTAINKVTTSWACRHVSNLLLRHQRRNKVTCSSLPLLTLTFRSTPISQIGPGLMEKCLFPFYLEKDSSGCRRHICGKGGGQCAIPLRTLLLGPESDSTLGRWLELERERGGYISIYFVSCLSYIPGLKHNEAAHRPPNDFYS